MEDVVKVESASIQYNQDRANIDSQVSTAKAYPRDIARSVTNAIFIATMDSETAAGCTYSVPRGGKPITGPSVNLARILVQTWGNLRAETKVVDITDKHIVSQATCWDIENNVAVKVEVRRSIMTKNGRMNDDMITVTGNAGNAIAYRNAVYNVLPKSVIEKVYKSAMGMITGDVSDETKLIKRRAEVVDKLKKAFGVTDEEILYAVGKAKMEYIMADEIVVLIGIGTAIKEGDTTVEMAFRASKKSEVSNVDKEAERISLMLSDCKTLEDIEKLEAQVKGSPDLFEKRKSELANA